MRNRFDEQLDHLNDEMVEMGNLCEQVISGAINITIADHDDNKVQEVLDIDAEIDRKEREIEKAIRVGLDEYLNHGGIENANFLIHAGNG